MIEMDTVFQDDHEAQMSSDGFHSVAPGLSVSLVVSESTIFCKRKRLYDRRIFYRSDTCLKKYHKIEFEKLLSCTTISKVFKKVLILHNGGSYREEHSTPQQTIKFPVQNKRLPRSTTIRIREWADLQCKSVLKSEVRYLSWEIKSETVQIQSGVRHFLALQRTYSQKHYIAERKRMNEIRSVHVLYLKRSLQGGSLLFKGG